MILEAVFNIFLNIYLIGGMVFYIPGQTQYIPQEMFIQYSAIVFCALSWFIPKKRDISNVYIGAILLYAVIHTVTLAFDSVSRYTLVNFFLGISTIKIIAERVSFDFKEKGKLLLGFIAFNIALMALQLINKDPIFSSMNPQNMPQVDIVGFMGIRFALGVLAAFSLPFIFSFNPVYCAALLPLLYYSKASTTILAALLSFSTLLWFKNKKLLLVLGALAAIPSFYYIFKIDMPSGEFEKRLEVWFAGVQILKLKPWFGYGFGQWAAMNFADIQKNGQPEIWIWAHNDIFQYVFEQGVLGAALLYIYFKDLFKNFVFDKNGKTIFSLMVSLIVISIFHFPFHSRFPGFCIYIFALLEAHRSETNGFKHLLRSLDEKAVPSPQPIAI